MRNKNLVAPRWRYGKL